jgi:hypothetical protein
MSMWSMSSDARASRIALIMVGGGDAAGLARALDAEGLTVVGWWASVTSAGGQSSARGSA